MGLYEPSLKLNMTIKDQLNKLAENKSIGKGICEDMKVTPESYHY